MYLIGLNKKVNFNFVVQKAYLFVKYLSTLRSKRKLRTCKFISQCTKTGCDLFYNNNFAPIFRGRSGGFNQSNLDLPNTRKSVSIKRPSKSAVGDGRFLNKKSCKLSFCNLSRINWWNLSFF